jgi:hypothetical protein
MPIYQFLKTQLKKDNNLERYFVVWFFAAKRQAIMKKYGMSAENYAQITVANSMLNDLITEGNVAGTTEAIKAEWNAAIANGYFEFPNGRVDFKNVHFVAAGNTVGSGADDMYTGRMVLDQATLDRFAIIEFDYSLTIEMAITKNNTELVSFIRQMRDEAKNKGIRATFSYRCMTMITKLEKAGMDTVMALTIAVVKGLDKDTVNTFTPVGSTKYHDALRKIQMAA